MIKSNRGFTLIELLVVIAIIGILSSVVLASLNTARQKSRDARRLADIQQIKLALELFADTHNGEYPDAIADLVTDGQFGSEPKDPSTQLSYVYQNLTNSAGGACAIETGTCLYYQLGAILEDADHSALDSDSDANLTGGFDGDSEDCAGAGTVDQCYDVTP